MPCGGEEGLDLKSHKVSNMHVLMGATVRKHIQDQLDEKNMAANSPAYDNGRSSSEQEMGSNSQGNGQA